MKYIWKNIGCFIKYDTYIWVLFVVTVFVSALLTCFSYGVYQNYHVLKKNSAAEIEYVLVEFDQNDRSYVTKDMLDPCLKELGNRVDEMANNIDACSVNLDIDGGAVECIFLLHGDSIAYADNVAKNMLMYGVISSGSYWNMYDEKANKRVAVCYDYRNASSNIWSDFIEKHMQGEDVIELQGEEYQITGWGTVGAAIHIPYNTLHGDTRLQRFLISFDEGVTQQTYSLIKEVFFKYLKGHISIPNIQGIKSNQYYLYQTVSLIVIFMMVICVFNSVFLYLYVFTKRKRQSAIMQICGLAEWKAYLIHVGECAMLGIPVYTVAILLYKQCIMQTVSTYFPYMRFAYNTKVYVWLIIGYAILTILISGIMIYRKKYCIQENL